MAEKNVCVLPCSSTCTGGSRSKSNPKSTSPTTNSINCSLVSGSQTQKQLSIDNKLSKLPKQAYLPGNSFLSSNSNEIPCQNPNTFQNDNNDHDENSQLDGDQQHQLVPANIPIDCNEKYTDFHKSTCNDITKTNTNSSEINEKYIPEKINGIATCHDPMESLHLKAKSNLIPSACLNTNISQTSCDDCKRQKDTTIKKVISDTKLSESTNCDNLNLVKNDLDSSCQVDKLLDQLEKCTFSKNQETPQPNVINGISYIVYESEKQMSDIMKLITKDLSEPYSIYTYRYFIHNWPKLCFLAQVEDKCVGAIVCKLDVHKKMVRRGYIAMLAVDSEYRRRQIGSSLVTKAIQAMIRDDCDEVVLETEITNQGALNLYENLGFVRDKRLFRYYLNGVDALRLKLWLR